MHEAGELLSDQRFRLSVHTYEIASRGMRDLPRVPVAGGASTDGGVPARRCRERMAYSTQSSPRPAETAWEEWEIALGAKRIRKSISARSAILGELCVGSPLSSGTDRTGMCTSGPSAAILGFVS
jgi:hypothetical protein